MASVVVTMDAREAQLFRAMDKLLTQQNKINQKFRDGERVSKKSSDTAAKSIGNIVTQYVSLQAGMQIVNNLAAEYARLQQASLTATRNLAAAQQESIKNLQGLSILQKEELMTSVVEGIQKRTGFAGRDQLVAAIGAGISAGGSVDAVVSAVESAAMLNLNTPDALVSSASGALDIARATGINDAQKNIGFLLSTGAVSRVESPEKLANSLGKSLGSVIATTPNADQEEAARQAAALFAVLNRAANDKQGDSTATGSVQFANYLREFLGEDAPGTLQERIQTIAADPQLRRDFLEKMPGEAVFKIPMEQLVTQGSDLMNEFVDNASNRIQFSTQAFLDNVDQVQGLTPALQVATEGIRARSNVETYDLGVNNAVRAQIAEIAAETLPRTRAGGVSGAVQQAVETVNAPFVPSIFPDAESFGQFTLSQLRARQGAIRSGGVTDAERASDELLTRQIESIERLLGVLEKSARAQDAAAGAMRNGQGNGNARAQAAGVGGG